MIDPIQHITELFAGDRAIREAQLTPPVMDEATLDAVEDVIIRRRSLTRHTADAKAVSLVLADVQKLRPTPDGDAA